MKAKSYLFILSLCLCLCQSFSYSQCTTASYGQFPSSNFTNAVWNGVPQEISPSCYAGEYSAVNVTYGNTYVFSSSVSSDYITLTQTAGNDVIDFGTGSVSYQAEYTGLVYFYTHTDNVCGESATYRSRLVSCSLPTGCLSSAAYGDFPDDVYTNTICDGVTAEIISESCYAGEYSRVTVVQGNTYTFSSSVATDYVTVSDQNGTIVYKHGVTPVTYQATSNGVVRFYLHTNVLCDDENVSRSRIVKCTPQLFCNSGNIYPAATYTVPTCDQVEYVITTTAYGGEYSNINMESAKAYILSSSVSTDYITVTSADGLTLLQRGYTPLIFNPAADGMYRYYLHSDIFCGAEQANRERRIACSTHLGVEEQNTLDLTIYPNPTHSNVTITANAPIENIQVISIDGKVLFNQQPASLSTTISLEQFQSGTYFIRATINGMMVQTKEVVKQ